MQKMTLEAFSKLLFEMIQKQFAGLVDLDKDFHIRIHLLTGEFFEIQIIK